MSAVANNNSDEKTIFLTASPDLGLAQPSETCQLFFFISLACNF
jgi:hypothetical protein